MREIDWNNHEQVVRAARVGGCFHPDTDWAKMRAQPFVRAFELAHNPAKQPAGEGSAVGERPRCSTHLKIDGVLEQCELRADHPGIYHEFVKGHVAMPKDYSGFADPQPSAVADGKFAYFRCMSCGFNGAITDEEIAKHRSQCAHGPTIAVRKPEDDLGELERLAKGVKLAQYACGLRGWFSDEALVVHPLVDGRRFIAACSPDRILALYDRVRTAEQGVGRTESRRARPIG